MTDTTMTRTGNETDRLETMLTAVSGMCQQLTTLQRAVVEGNVNTIQLSDILVGQARALENALQQYRTTVDASFRAATQETVSVIKDELNMHLDIAATSAIKNHLSPQIDYFVQQQEERLAILEASARETRDLTHELAKKRYDWRVFVAAIFLVVITGALSSMMVTKILMPKNIVRMDDIRLAALSAGGVLLDAWPKLSAQEKSEISQSIQKANNQNIGKFTEPNG